MGVARHLRIALDEYDDRIRAFVPHYDRMVRGVASTLDDVVPAEPTIVDLGIGTGALAAACLGVRPGARIVGIDADPAMLEAARARLADVQQLELIAADFTSAKLPECDAIVACIALHHVATPAAKRELYARCARALRPGGCVVSADCFPARHTRLAGEHREAWLAHLEKNFTRAEAEGHLAAWAGEDVYFPLADELAWLREAGLHPEVVWRQDGFAIVTAFAPG